MPVEDYPTLPDMPPAAGTVGSDAFAAAVGQVAVAAGRDDTLPDAHRRADGDRGRHRDPRLHRPLPARGPRAHWSREQPDISAVALVPAKTLADTAKSLTARRRGRDRAGRPRARGEGMIGFEGGGRRTTTRLLDGEFPKYRSLLPDRVLTRVADVQTAAFVEAVKRVALVAERNTPVRLSLHAAARSCSRPAPATRPRLWRRSSADSGGRRHRRSPSTHRSCWTGSARSTPTSPRLQFTTSTKPAILTGKPADDGERPGLPVPDHACAARPADPSAPAIPATTGPRPGYEQGKDSMQLGMVGLGKMGGNMAERLRRGGHEVVGYDRDPERQRRRHASRSWWSELHAPRAVWVMVPAGRAHPAHDRRARRAAVARRHRHRRRQLPLHGRPEARRRAGRQGHRLRRLRGQRRRLGPARTATR